MLTVPQKTRVKNSRKKRKIPSSVQYLEKPRSRLRFFGSGAPDELRLTLCYAQEFNLTSTGITAGQAFRGNSVYDPDFSGVGDQPLYYSQWQTIYERFRVLGSKIILKAVTSNTPGTHLAVAAIPDTNFVSAATNLQNLSSQKYAMNKFIRPSGNESTFIMEASTSALFGIPESAIELDDTYQGTIASDPAKSWIWQITHVPTDKVATATTYCNMCIEYDVILFDRLNVTQ